MTDSAGPGSRACTDAQTTGPPPPLRRSRLRAAVHGARTVSRGWWAWTSDYVYVGWRQVRGTVASGDPARYSTGSKVPVVLLPGIYETWFFLEPLARVLHDAGHPVHTVPGLRHNLADLDDSSRLVAERLAALDLDRVVIVAHSKGGLIGKHLMSATAGPASATADPPQSGADPGTGTSSAGRAVGTTAGSGTGHDASSGPPATVVAGMVALNTPFAGSRYATYFPSRPVRALSPRFPAMRTLALQLAAHSRIVSVYGVFDPHVPGGSALAGATNVQLPVMGHFRTVAHPAVKSAVLEHVERLGRSTPERPQDAVTDRDHPRDPDRPRAPGPGDDAAT